MQGRNGLADIANNLGGHRVLVAGDVILDEYVWGEVQRISPEAPVPVVETRSRTYRPGGAANVAANIASLAGKPLLCGVIGKDPQGAQLCFELEARAIDVGGLLVDEGRPTTAKTRIIAQNQQIVRVDAEIKTGLRTELERALLVWAEKNIDSVGACVLSDYGKGVVSDGFAGDFIEMAQKAGKPVIVDPKGRDYRKYRRATVVTPNLREAEQAANREINGGGELLEVGRQLLDNLSGSALLVTRGAEGMSLFEDGCGPLHIPAVARNVYDVTGAGDTVIGALALAMAAGNGLEDAARIANYAAGIVVGKVGTACVTIEELIQVIKSEETIKPVEISWQN